VSSSWEQRFPLCSLTAVTRIVSDQNPLILVDGEKGILLKPRFFFQTWWLGVPGFQDMVSDKIRECITGKGPHRSSVDLW
jgi:hypothetical protein